MPEHSGRAHLTVPSHRQRPGAGRGCLLGSGRAGGAGLGRGRQGSDRILWPAALFLEAGVLVGQLGGGREGRGVVATKGRPPSPAERPPAQPAHLTQSAPPLLTGRQTPLRLENPGLGYSGDTHPSGELSFPGSSF